MQAGKKKTYLRYCYILISISLCFRIETIIAQTIDTTQLFIKEIIIIDSKESAIKCSKKVVRIDSTILKMSSTSSLAELLSSQANIHIKSYGNGNLATSSIRGGNASQTAVLWNGLSIQNPMLGQTDLSLIQTSLFDNLSIEYGGGSAAWGSGAVGGSIHLQNKLFFNEGIKTKVQMSYGSFNTQKLNTTVVFSEAKFYSSTRFYFINSKNNYTYLDTTNKEQPRKEVKHANYSTKGIMQEFGFLINKHNTINVKLWYSMNDRNLPTFTQALSLKNQIDKNFRTTVDWEFKKNEFTSIVKAAYFKDKLNYSDSISSIFSESDVHTYIIENDNNYKIKNSLFHFGLNYTQYKTDTKNYNETHQLNKIAAFIGYSTHLMRSKLNYNIFLRKEITNQIEIPFTGTTGLKYHFTKKISAKLDASKSYRQPSLNDLYWKQGGNVNLKPEDSKELNAGLDCVFLIKNVSLTIEGSYFNRQTKNWIIWLPSDKGYWTPRNILEVYSRGTELKTNIAYRKNDLVLRLDLNTSYILSTNQKNINENDNSKDRQLIYSPRYTGNASFLIQYKTITALYNYNYTGYRFTSTDNTSWLMPYQISNLKIEAYRNFNKIKFTLFGSINNLFNQNYVVVTSNPMPLINYEIGISIRYLNNNLNKNKK